MRLKRLHEHSCKLKVVYSQARGSKMLLLIDNYDSFTYNLYQYLSELLQYPQTDQKVRANLKQSSTSPDRGYSSPTMPNMSNDFALDARIEVRRNDRVTLDEIESLQPNYIVISPGPCTPNEAGLSCQIIQTFGPRIPTLGVCLGHQAIGQVYGGRVIRAPEPMHGKTSLMYHEGKGVLRNLPQPFAANRYHSLIVEGASLPHELEITATTEDGLIMGLRHRTHPVEGVQFHPESIMTPVG